MQKSLDECVVNDVPPEKMEEIQRSRGFCLGSEKQGA